MYRLACLCLSLALGVHSASAAPSSNLAAPAVEAPGQIFDVAFANGSYAWLFGSGPQLYLYGPGALTGVDAIVRREAELAAILENDAELRALIGAQTVGNLDVRAGSPAATLKVPEPRSLAILAAGLFGLAWARRKFM